MKMNIIPFALTILTASGLLAGPHYSDWSEPVNLGPVINSSANDNHPAISKDGLSLYMTSNRPGGFGGDDIWVSQRASTDAPWRSPQNLGPNVNTTSDDGVPTFSRDGHWMFFGTTRPGGYGGSDIWVSYRRHTHDNFGWGPPVNLGPGVNTAADEDGPTVFEDEDTGIATLYFTSLNRLEGLGDWDIYASTLDEDGTFGAAVLVSELSVAGTATTGRDTRTAIRHDGLEIFITSNRPGGLGGIDLWVSTRESTLDPWSPPVNLGSTANTSFVDGAPALSLDAETLYFYSTRPGGFGGRDLYMSTRTKVHGKP